MLPAFKKILYCTDLSASAEYACRYAIYLARQTGAEIYVLHVAEMPSPDALITLETYIKDFNGREAFIKQRLRETKEQLTQRLRDYIAALPEDEQPDTDHIKAINVLEAHPVDEILHQSEGTAGDRRGDLGFRTADLGVIGGDGHPPQGRGPHLPRQRVETRDEQLTDPGARGATTRRMSQNFGPSVSIHASENGSAPH